MVQKVRKNGEKLMVSTVVQKVMKNGEEWMVSTMVQKVKKKGMRIDGPESEEKWWENCWFQQWSRK